MISVVIPLYNKEEYIASTLQSVLDQTYAQFEVLVVDDGSTDGSAEVVQRFNDARVQFISIPNSGVSVARNKGIELAKHDYIAFLDGDDSWAPTFLANMHAVIQEHPSRSLFASGRSSIFKDRKLRYAHEWLPAEGEVRELNHYQVISKYLPAINMSNSIVKKQMFASRGMFRKGQKNHEDHDLWLRLAVGEPIVYLHKNLSFYRKDVLTSASKGSYSTTDFCTYMRTIAEVAKVVTSEEKKYLQTYANRFILLTYLQYASQFTTSEEKEVYRLAKKITTGIYTFGISMQHYLPFKGAYPLLKRWK